MAGKFAEHEGGMVLFRPAGIEHEETFGARGAAYGVIDVGGLFIDTARRWGFDIGTAASARHPDHDRLTLSLRREAGVWDEYSPLVCEGFTLECLASLVRAAAELKDEGAQGRLAANALEYVKAHIGEPFGLTKVAEAVGAHPSHLARAFKTAYGQSLGVAARRLRVARAADLIATSRMPLAEIALDCGFSSQAHLTTVFRAAMGATPAAYRRLAGC